MVFPFLFALATQSNAHEFWLEPKKFQATTGETLKIDVRNGEDFKGIDLSWFDPRVQSAAVVRDGQITAYQGLPGDLPAMTVEPGAGLTTVTYASKLTRLTYDSWEKVLRFADHKGFDDFQERHAERGLPEKGVTEGYWRFSKTLVTGPDAGGADVDTGMETEFVALTNPFAGTDSFSARLLYQGTPRAEAQVEVWEKIGEDVTKTILHTDDTGTVTLPVRPGAQYMLDAVVLREPQSDAALEKSVMWETLWANLTFAVPE